MVLDTAQQRRRQRRLQVHQFLGSRVHWFRSIDEKVRFKVQGDGRVPRL